ncbi:MAG: SIMPL domain-containing protein [Bacteroidales bacterium]|nr:SIMPL domain-containing protein [Bacteroidales bacterium]MBN2747920.1 SIMPL domain-containing protein [Bacteroidales bacterium]
MKRLLLALFLVPFTLFAQQGEKNFIDQNYIDVMGKAEMEVSPDLIYLAITINEKDTRNKVSVSQLEEKMINKLREIGVDVPKDLFIKDLTSDFKSYLLLKSDIMLSKEYQLLVHNGKMAGQVYIELEKLGISNIAVDRVDHSKMEQFRREVKVKAIKAAKEKANELTQAIGQTAGRALFIREVEMPSYRSATANVMIRGYSSGGSGKAAAPEMDFEKIKIEYSVQCYFELK